MSDKKINLEKVIGNLGENIFPNIEYFMNEESIRADGNVDGSNDGLYQGLVRGEGLDELNIDENILNSNNPILELCKIILDKNGTLFFKLGLIYYEGNEFVIDDDELFGFDEYSEVNYSTGGYGIYLTKDDWDYGYYTHCLSHCFLPPEEKFYHLTDDKEDEIAVEIIKRIEEMDIFD